MGNLLNLIDYDCDAEFDRELLNKQLDRLSPGTHNFSSKLKKTIKSKKSKIQVEELDTQPKIELLNFIWI